MFTLVICFLYTFINISNKAFLIFLLAGWCISMQWFTLWVWTRQFHKTQIQYLLVYIVEWRYASYGVWKYYHYYSYRKSDKTIVLYSSCQTRVGRSHQATDIVQSRDLRSRLYPQTQPIPVELLASQCACKQTECLGGITWPLLQCILFLYGQ